MIKTIKNMVVKIIKYGTDLLLTLTQIKVLLYVIAALLLVMILLQITGDFSIREMSFTHPIGVFE